MSSLSRAPIGVIVALVLLAAVPGASAKSAPTGSLKTGESVYWNGARVEDLVFAPGVAVDPCEIGRCWSYALEIAERADLLRVAIDVPMRDDQFDFTLISPSGQTIETSNVDTYNAEAFARDPEVGVWRIEVSTLDATDSAFRMRARLENDKPPPRGKPRVTLPNLQINPPHEFGFIAPANPFNGLWPPDDVNPGLDVAGIHPVSCSADEIAEDGAEKCLRFSAGPVNSGVGPFEIVLGPDSKAFQRVYLSDGSFFEREAGTHELHKTHGHSHYTDVLTYELFRVTHRGRGALEPAGVGVKSGFCPADQNFADWHSFRQAPAVVSQVGSCNSVMGLSMGWGDVYRWQRPGQYVEFGDNEDGFYLVRATADINGWVMESNENDNTGYAFIKVTGDEVKVLERGRGTDPWDSEKTVTGDWWLKLAS